MMKRATLDSHPSTEKASWATRLEGEEEEKENGGETVLSYEALGNILGDFCVKDFMATKKSLWITPEMKALDQELEMAIHYQQGDTRLLQGPTGIGKTTTLLYLGHVARTKGYLVFPLQARNFVNQTAPMSCLIHQFLLSWIDAVGEDQLRQVPTRMYPNSGTLYDIANPSYTLDDITMVRNFARLVWELSMCTMKPVVFLIDQCNAFQESPQMIQMYRTSASKQVTPSENPMGALFLDWNTFRVRCGGIFYGFFSALALMPDPHSGNSCLFFPMQPMRRVDFQGFVNFLVQDHRLACECFDYFDDFFVLCGGIPSEACAFGRIALGGGGGGGDEDSLQNRGKEQRPSISNGKKST